MPSRLILALAFSLVLHAVVLFWDAVRFADRPAAQPPLAASLRLPAKTPPRAEDPLLKDTLSADPPTVKPPPATRPATSTGLPLNKAAAKRQVEAAKRKLSQHVYYPPDAVARGLEGEVRLLLRVSDDGHVSDVSIAASSGHAILDQAAVKAAYAMGKVNWVQSRELILPVVFRLE
ncbi:MAG: TonB family protein [Thiobacillaceae bacterium]|jgi:protein TonB|nr:TonB family protein [Thiobacillaceae bacterium]